MANLTSDAEVLQLYQQREVRRWQARQQGEQTLVQLSLNLHFLEQVPPGADGLFAWGLRQLLELLPQLVSCRHGHDRLGPWALLGAVYDAEKLKRQTVALESAHSAGVLLDIDIYDPLGQRLGREMLKLPPRHCLICREPAKACLHNRVHQPSEVRIRTKKLLAPFRT